MRRIHPFLGVILLCVFVLAPAAEAKEAKKIKIVSVQIDGNHVYSDGQIMRLMLSRPSGFLHRSYYYPEVFDDDQKHIIDYYEQNGYLDVKIASAHSTIDSTNWTARLSITIDEGELTHVEGLEIFGNSVFPDSMLLSEVHLRPGDAFKKKYIQDGMLSMLSMYADHGYIEAVVTPDIRINSEKHLALVDFTVNESSKFTIDKINIVGLKRTREYVVTRELLFKPGDVVHYSKLQESQRKLYLTGLFQSVFIRTQAAANGDSTQKDILVDIKESISSELGAKIGYGSVEKVNGEVDMSTTNLAGTARQIGADIYASFIKRRVETSFTEPWTFGTRFRTDINFFAEYLKEPGYNISRYGGKLTVGRSFARNSEISLSYRYENAMLNHVKVTTLPSDFDSKIRSVTLSLTNDTRDNLFNPTHGSYLEWSNDFAGAFLTGNYTFVRSVLIGKYFRQLRASTIVGSAITAGWMEYFGNSQDIPLNERFYAGGPNSLRAFNYHKVGPLQNNNVPLGGRYKLVWNVVEIRQSVYKIIGMTYFLDIGNIWYNISDAGIGDIRSDAGTGIFANTAIGILRLEYAFDLDRRSWEPPGKLYFSIGFAF
jgi:outer membrane protein insertion porin family